jgi:hypothetical protein
MNWKLIFSLSLFGLALGIASVWIPMNVEFILWLVVFIICAWLIAKNVSGKYFLYGFLLSLVNCVWVTGAHVLLYSTYMANHHDMVKNAQMPLQGHYRLNMLIIGPIVGIVYGLVLGLFAWIASKLVKKPAATAS